MPKLHIYRRKHRGPIWQAQVYVGGRRYRFSCLTDGQGHCAKVRSAARHGA